MSVIELNVSCISDRCNVYRFFIGSLYACCVCARSEVIYNQTKNLGVYNGRLVVRAPDLWK